MATTTPKTKDISEEEAALYDRQVRPFSALTSSSKAVCPFLLDAPAPTSEFMEADGTPLQIRLWGAAAQSRLQAARVLLAGRFRGIAVDAAKNVVLAGVGALTLLDGEDLTVEDLGSNYFARVEEVGQKVRFSLSIFPISPFSILQLERS
jgi:hypothetical protein